MAFLEIALKYVQCTPKNQHWVLLIDSMFYLKMDKERIALLFNKLSGLDDLRIQTIFCMNSEKEAEILKDVQSDKWINAAHIKDLTVHSFL
jgi:hypothetical protein